MQRLSRLIDSSSDPAGTQPSSWEEHDNLYDKGRTQTWPREVSHPALTLLEPFSSSVGSAEALQLQRIEHSLS